MKMFIILKIGFFIQNIISCLFVFSLILGYFCEIRPKKLNGSSNLSHFIMTDQGCFTFTSSDFNVFSSFESLRPPE